MDMKSTVMVTVSFSPMQSSDQCLRYPNLYTVKIYQTTYIYIIIIIKSRRLYGFLFLGGAHGVMVIVVRNGYGDTSSNPRRD